MVGLAGRETCFYPYTTLDMTQSPGIMQRCLLVSILVTLMQCGESPGDAPWPMFRHDPLHSGRSIYH
ncbi:MAG: hypothetical protein ACK4WF_03940, partial [Candidatus Brocadiales bacterium]